MDRAEIEGQGPSRTLVGYGKGRTMFGDHRAVSIRLSAGCCRAAHELDHKRFLSAEAPALPLKGCSSPEQCSCAYRRLADRRDDYRPAARQPARGLLRFFSNRRSTDVA